MGGEQKRGGAHNLQIEHKFYVHVYTQTIQKLDGVPRTQTSCGTYYSLSTVAEATALLFQHVKGAIIVDHVTPPQSKKSTPDDCERTATEALPTAASAGFISGELGISAALDAFSTVYELPLMRFENRLTNRQTNIRT